jgi:large subunit ribosomal protein L28
MSTGMECANCKKGIMHGHNMSHAKNRTNRIFEPNLHPARIMIDGAMKRVRLCTKCLRKAKKAIKFAVKVAPKSTTVATA